MYFNVFMESTWKEDHEYGKITGTLNFELKYGRIIV